MGKFQLLHAALQFRFLFGLPALGNLFAEGAGMLAIKNFLQGRFESVGPCVVSQHRCPGNGLEHRPVTTSSAKQRHD